MDTTAKITWINVQDEEPDADVEVLMAIDDDSVETGYHDGEEWKYCPGCPVQDLTVLYWAEYPNPPTSNKQ